jgi:hypothetical protein
VTVPEFASHLITQGAELYVRRGGRLHLWPSKAFRSLSAEDRDYLRANREELRALVLAGLHPRLPNDFDPNAPSPAPVAPAPPPPPQPTCDYCGNRPCVGREHVAFDVLHWNEPEQIEQRAKRATAEMRESLRRYGLARY